MVKIFKYKASPFSIALPHYVKKFLSIQRQGDDIVCWAIIDTEKKPNYFGLEAIGTGWDITEELKGRLGEYVGTATDTEGLVWHYFTMPKKK